MQCIKLSYCIFVKHDFRARISIFLKTSESHIHWQHHVLEFNHRNKSHIIGCDKYRVVNAFTCDLHSRVLYKCITDYRFLVKVFTCTGRQPCKSKIFTTPIHLVHHTFQGWRFFCKELFHLRRGGRTVQCKGYRDCSISCSISWKHTYGCSITCAMLTHASPIVFDKAGDVRISACDVRFEPGPSLPISWPSFCHRQRLKYKIICKVASTAHVLHHVKNLRE
jgi:hypothetical protein